MPEIKLEWYEEFLTPRSRNTEQQLQSLRITAKYDADTQEVDHDTVEIWIWEKNKAKLNITHMADKFDFFNKIVDNVPWRELYRNSRYADENDLYETQFERD